MSLRLQDLYHGSLGSISVKAQVPIRQLLADHRDFTRVAEDAYHKLLSIIRNGDDFYARIHDGCRAGSIVRVNGNQYKFEATSHGYRHRGRRLDKMGFSRMLDAVLVQDYNNGTTLYLEAHQQIASNIHGRRVKAQYDDRKEVGLSQDERMSLEFLPDYEGPTVYCYSRRERTPEERAEDAKPDQFPVYDQIGEEIKLGDLFFHGEANAIQIGKLLKVGKTGSISYKPYVGQGSRRIISESVRKAITKGQPVPSFLRYSKDLGDKLMIFKLAKL